MGKVARPCDHAKFYVIFKLCLRKLEPKSLFRVHHENMSNVFLMVKFVRSMTVNNKAKVTIPAIIYFFKVNSRKTRKTFEIYSKLTIKKPERRH